MKPVLAAVVPTIGGSPRIAEALEALHQERVGGEPLRTILVWQGSQEAPESRLADLCHRVIDVPHNLGFSAATNLGIDAAREAGAREHGARWIATVNDDLRVAPGWAATLVEALEADPEVCAVQGVNLQWGDPSQTDGCGLAWNRWWQAVQLDHGEAPPSPDAPTEEIFGVSATAAIYRRSALDALGEAVFDSRLGSYYEDVDLACRLRAMGGRALLVPQARALHAGSSTGARRPLRRWRSIHGNRLLVLARLLGRRFRAALPTILGRDLRDGVAALGKADLSRLVGILAGWGRAARHLSAYAHRGEPRVPLAELERFRVSSSRP